MRPAAVKEYQPEGASLRFNVDRKVKVVRVFQPGASARAADTPACRREGMPALGR